MIKQVIISLKLLFLLTILTGVFYPLAVTLYANFFFKDKANGSLIYRNSLVIGSSLVGQSYDSSVYFWSRPSVNSYNPLPSGGSNLGPLSKRLKDQVENRAHVFREFNSIPDNIDIPSEMVFASASGLDPHISPRAALVQVSRIVHNRKFSKDQEMILTKLVIKLTEKPDFQILGEARINVFLLNLELDKIK